MHIPLLAKHARVGLSQAQGSQVVLLVLLGAGQMLVHPRVPTAPMAKPLCPPGPARVPPAPPGLTAKEAPRVQVALVQRTPSAQGTLPV